MTSQQAAELLHARLRGYPWFVTIGIGQHEGNEAIFIYVKTLRNVDLSFLSAGWEGFPVFVERMGMPRALESNADLDKTFLSRWG